MGSKMSQAEKKFRYCIKGAAEKIQKDQTGGKYVWGNQIIDLENGLHFYETTFVDALFRKMMEERTTFGLIGWEVSYPNTAQRVDIAYGHVSDTVSVFRRPVEIKLWHASCPTKCRGAVMDDAKKLQEYRKAYTGHRDIYPAVLVIAKTDDQSFSSWMGSKTASRDLFSETEEVDLICSSGVKDLRAVLFWVNSTS